MGPAPKPGDEDPDIINASKKPVTLLPGASIFHHTDAFAMILGGHIDLALLGAMQVGAIGGLANWSTGDEKLHLSVSHGSGAGAASVWVLMEHTSRTESRRSLSAAPIRYGRGCCGSNLFKSSSHRRH
jgi:3-oxoadipate CoA-transferase beta subunit